jgi:diadenosine tetraphosphate (Ap4A) HIT family hydrolase
MSAVPPSPRRPDPKTTDRDPDCVFCDILAGDAEASFVYRAETIAAFMTLGAVNPGHVLIVPIRHAAHLADLDPALGAEMFKVAMEIAAAVRSSGLRCEGVNLLLNDGRAAFQSVFHTHLHVFPRYRGDGFGLIMPPHFSPRRTRPELDEAAARIRTALESRL